MRKSPGKLPETVQKHLTSKASENVKKGNFSLVIFASVIIFLIVGNFFLENPSRASLDYISAQNLYSHCLNSKSTTNCYKKQFEIWAKTLNFTNNVKILQNLRQIDPKVQVCHGYAHIISSEEVVKNPQDWTHHLREINPTDCSSGFIHGAIEGLERSNPNFSISSDFIKSTCAEISTVKNGIAAERIQNTCAHAMGHILLVEKSADIDKALAECPGFNRGFSTQCFRGIFMESIFKSNLVYHGLSAKPEFSQKEVQNQENICNSQKPDRAESCWDIISNLDVEASEGNYPKTLNLCNHAPSEKLKVICSTSAAQYLFIKAESGIFENIKNPGQLCSNYINNEFASKTCIQKILLAVFENHLNEKAYTFCQEIDSKFRGFCKSNIREISGRFSS